MALLEREEPLASLAAYGDEARLGQGRLVLVAGEAGVGKSALVERFTAGLTGTRCYLGACDGLFTPRPLGAFLDIAGQLGGEPAELAGRFDASAAREELFALLLGELGAPGGLRAVVVEDIHWADEATLDLLRFLARRIGSLPVLLVATYRDDELAASYPLRTALGDLAVQRCTRRVDLAPLSAAAVAALSAGSGLDAAELYRVTGGNAFYVTETLRTGLDQVPRSAVDAVLARVAGLGPGARDVLHAAALIGSVVEPWLLEQAADCPPSTVDELVDRGLLTADGAVLRFRHEIARRAVAQEIPAHRQPAIHARLLAALLAAGSTDHARLAFHAEAAGDDPATLEHATLAGRHAAELGSHQEAAAQFERALRVAHGEPPAVLADRYYALASELSVIDSWDAAAAAYERALSLWRAAGDPLREGDVLCRLSSTFWRLCRGREASNASEAAVRVLEPLGPSVELARAYASVAADLARQARFAETMALARRAETLAASLGAFGVQANTLNLQAWAGVALGEDWEPPLYQALDITLSHGMAYEAGHIYTNLHEVNCAEHRYAASEPHYLAGVAHCEEHDLGVYLTCLHGVRTSTLDRLGRWDEAVALAEVGLAMTVSSPVNRMIPQGTLGRILARRGAAGRVAVPGPGNGGGRRHRRSGVRRADAAEPRGGALAGGRPRRRAPGRRPRGPGGGRHLPLAARRGGRLDPPDRQVADSGRRDRGPVPDGTGRGLARRGQGARRPRVPVRRGAGAPLLRRGRSAAAGPGRLPGPRRGRHRPARPPHHAPARDPVDPGRAACRHAPRPGRPDPARA